MTEYQRFLQMIADSPNIENMPGQHLNEAARAQLAFSALANLKARAKDLLADNIADPDLKQVCDFLESIGDAGYGGMSEYDIALETMRRLTVSPQQLGGSDD